MTSLQDCKKRISVHFTFSFRPLRSVDVFREIRNIIHFDSYMLNSVWLFGPYLDSYSLPPVISTSPRKWF